MLRELLPKSLLLVILSVLALPVIIVLFAPETTVSAQTGDSPGALTVVDATGKAKSTCPLKHTDVKAEISGFISRVIVTQQFQNPFQEKIEAVYTFPLPQNAAVDDMTMIVGDRTVHGKILPREEAQAVYEAAKSSGQVASLLDQERPNIFTQSVANILPGEQVKITISYVETLSYVNGAYEFVFPMVVGPRYIPGAAKPASQGNGFAPDTNRVPDASRITPNSPPPGMRSGHDISLEVAHVDGSDIYPEGRRHGLDSSKLAGPTSLSGISKHCCSRHTRRNLLEQFQPLPTDAVFGAHEPSGITARSRQAIDEARGNWIASDREHDRHTAGQLH